MIYQQNAVRKALALQTSLVDAKLNGCMWCDVFMPIQGKLQHHPLTETLLNEEETEKKQKIDQLLSAAGLSPTEVWMRFAREALRQNSHYGSCTGWNTNRLIAVAGDIFTEEMH